MDGFRRCALTGAMALSSWILSGCPSAPTNPTAPDTTGPVIEPIS